MKTDLTTAILAAIIGIVTSFSVCSFLLPALEGFSFKTIPEENYNTLAEPDANVFNFRALNPTVEVYVGNCTEYNEAGECLDGVRSVTNEEEIDDSINPGS